MSFDPTKPVRFSSKPDIPVTILTADRPGCHPWTILAMREDTGELTSHQANGTGGYYDLENIPETTIRYANLYTLANYASEDMARANAASDCRGTLKLTMQDGKLVEVELC